MEIKQAENFISRIVAGTIRFKIQDLNKERFYVLMKNCSCYHKYIANEMYEEILENALAEGMYDDEEINDILLNNNIWNEQKEIKIKNLQEDIEELKVRMFGMMYKTDEIKACKKVLALAKNDLANLFEEKTCLNHLSASGFAEIEKNKFLLAFSLFDTKNENIFLEEDYWNQNSFILDQIINDYKYKRINESQLRWLARNEPWRSLWMSKKTENSFFGVPTVQLNEEQKNILIWSAIYDNIYENPNQPPQLVIEDDDLLDGWMIIQRRNREKELNKKSIEETMISNERIKNSGEIFVPAKSLEDVKRIDSLNTADSQIVKRQRINQIKKTGQIDEVKMADTQLNLRKQANDKFKDKLK